LDKTLQVIYMETANWLIESKLILIANKTAKKFEMLNIFCFGNYAGVTSTCSKFGSNNTVPPHTRREHQNM
jgi:hypothetical protein